MAKTNLETGWLLILWEDNEVTRHESKKAAVYNVDSKAQIKRTKYKGVYDVENNRYSASIVKASELETILKVYGISKESLNFYD